MAERFERYERSESPDRDEALHRCFRPMDGPPPEREQLVGAKEGEPRQEGTWMDRGIQDVPLDRISLEDSPVHNANDFVKVPHDEMIQGIRVLESDVRPAVARGATRDDFEELDRVRGLDYAHSHQRVYDAFYGDQPIQLAKVGDQYTVASGGYHRLYVARELGLSTVPARVRELCL